MKIEPILPQIVPSEDPFYRLGLTEDNSAGPLSNEEMDKLIYET
jgi:hypothetical protein